MTSPRLLSGALVAGAVGIASLFAASPASAATLPEGQQITVATSNFSSYQLYGASPATAALTAVGTGGALPDSLAGMDVDDDGIGYAISNGEPAGELVATLHDVNANTGTFSDPRTVRLSQGGVQSELGYCTGIDYSAGVLQAICFTLLPNEDQVAYWGPIDPDAAPGEAWLTPLYTFDNDQVGDAWLNFTALAVHPITGVVYAVVCLNGTCDLYSLAPEGDPDAGATLEHPIALDNVLGFDFDRNGQGWITSHLTVDGSDVAALATLDAATGGHQFVDAFRDGNSTFSIVNLGSITVWGPAPALPATGPAVGAALPVGAALLLLAGAFMAAGVRRARQP